MVAAEIGMAGRSEPGRSWPTSWRRMPEVQVEQATGAGTLDFSQQLPLLVTVYAKQSARAVQAIAQVSALRPVSGMPGRSKFGRSKVPFTAGNPEMTPAAGLTRAAALFSQHCCEAGT